MVLVILVCYIVSYINRCKNVKTTWPPWNEPLLVIIFLIYFWNQLAKKFIKFYSVVLFSCNAFAWFWQHGHTSFIEWVGKYLYLFYFLKVFEWDHYYFFPLIFDVIHYCSHLNLDFLYGKVFKYTFNLFNHYRAIHIICFFWVIFGILCCSRHFSISS